MEEAQAGGARLVTLEDPRRLGLPETLGGRVEPALPRAALLLAAWAEREPGERAALAESPAQPFYLRPPMITSPGVRPPGGPSPAGTGPGTPS